MDAAGDIKTSRSRAWYCCANCPNGARTFWGELLLLTNWYRAGEPPVPRVCQNAMFFVPLGLALSEKQILQIAEKHREVKVVDGAVGVG